MVQNPFAVSVEDVITHLMGDRVRGLEEEEALGRLSAHGPNQIPESGPKKRWRILADHLADPIIYILVVAAVLAFLFNDFLEGMAILIVILISVAIGFFMELQTVRSLEELRKMGQAMTYVLRSGQKVHIKASEVVPGDLLLVERGDVVAADARLIEVENLSVKESALTGESAQVSKTTNILHADIPLTDRSNMLFRGTTVTTGSGKAIVTATGRHTQLGHIQQMGVDALKERTPLEKKLKELSKWLIWLTLFFALIIIIMGYIRGEELLLMIETAVALAVAAIPEGLPIVATIALAQGMMRLSKKQVIIKKLEAVQTLGATDIICTDKTGTLTEDQMKVHSLEFGEQSLADIYHRKNDFLTSIKQHPVFHKMMMTAILCNNIDVESIEKQGDSIERALIDFATHMGYDPITVREKNPEKLELPFSEERKLMATAHRHQDHFHVYAKGAFENLTAHCDRIMCADGTKPFVNRQIWGKKVDILAEQGLRTLAFAYKEVKQEPVKQTLLEQLVFLGIMGFLDPAREDVKATIDTYKRAGIKVVMVTGDHPGTSEKIARDIGLLEREDDGTRQAVYRGKDLVTYMNASEVHNEQLRNASIFARVTPEQKLDLVRFYQKNNHIVGMIGDGINDVPALKKADIGIAMGVRGTEAAREVADVILKNDRFTAIELAIRQGRVVFQNIRQFVVYLLSCNLAEILSVGTAALLNLPSPLLPLQILFLNLVTDVFPALALGLGKGEEDVMEQPPKNPKDPIITSSDWVAILVYGLCIGIAVLGVVVYADSVLNLPSKTINNMAFYTLVLAQLVNVFNMPKRSESFFKNEVTANHWIWGAILLSLAITFGAYLVPVVATYLSLGPLSLAQMGTVIMFASGSLVLAQLVKRLIRLRVS
ncbi:cation-transporting P-type ATPase [Flavobacteriaceae bacterium TP-CH-4]|uniref:Cation-transporting P-type ATPase n=1 Tax=Pelagihabitans pacificus TaxID=2696054 RepID=A0A967ASV3_9FLAO|nr:cation-transporting P-type ATPase [Pelagihabitans pacificus]NHF59633.1 cation-transporting P-type ATPase [Pelagihabitans pacificus]